MSNLKARIKNRIATAFERRGLTVSGYGHANCLRHLLASEEIDTAVDVGANIGQYGIWLREVVRFTGTILSVEPASDSHAALSLRAASDGRWTVLPRCALGDQPGEAVLKVSENSVSSSILATTAKLEQMLSSVKAIREEVVPVRTLEAIRREYLKPGQRAFLKVDTQGFEKKVIAGLGSELELWPVIQLELSLVPLYEGEVDFTGMIRYLEELGYRIYAFFPSYWSHPAYRLLQIDCLFVRGSQATNL